VVVSTICVALTLVSGLALLRLLAAEDVDRKYGVVSLPVDELVSSTAEVSRDRGACRRPSPA
jgi:hypothetical protein